MWADNPTLSSNQAASNKNTDDRAIATAFRLPSGTTLNAKQEKACAKLKAKYESALREAMTLLHSKDAAEKKKGLKLNRETRAKIKADIKELLAAGTANAEPTQRNISNGNGQPNSNNYGQQNSNNCNQQNSNGNGQPNSNGYGPPSPGGGPCPRQTVTAYAQAPCGRSAAGGRCPDRDSLDSACRSGVRQRGRVGSIDRATALSHRGQHRGSNRLTRHIEPMPQE